MKICLGLILAVLTTAGAVVVFAQAGTIEGKWATNDGKVTMDLKVAGSVLTGTVSEDGKSFAVEDGKFTDSDTFAFAWKTAFPPMGNPVRHAAVGKLSGDDMALAIKVKVESTGGESVESMMLKRSK
jgi:hypothetical protein